MKIFRVAPNKIMKLTIFLFWIFEMFDLVSNFKVDLHQFWCSHFIKTICMKMLLTSIYKFNFGTSWTNMKVQFWSFFNQPHLPSLIYYLLLHHYFMLSKIKYGCHDARWQMQKWKIYSYFLLPNWGCYMHSMKLLLDNQIQKI